MHFFSDNAAAAHPAVLDALTNVNIAGAGTGAYDGDDWSTALDGAFSRLFETPVTALWVTTGTAANALALATLCPPWRGVVAAGDAHIQCDEAGAPEFFTGGAKILPLDAPGAKLTPDRVTRHLDAIPPSIHWVQPAALSLTNATEYGLCYTPDDMAAIGVLARARGLRLHLDGARFANACAFTGASPADLSWRAGVDILSFGFIKNGGLGAEALILFDPALADELRARRKRAGHLSSKGRFLAAQILALLEGDRWRANAERANAGAKRLADAAPERLVHPVEANAVFLRLTADEARRLRAEGFGFYDWASGEARFVVAWDTDVQAIMALADALKRL